MRTNRHPQKMSIPQQRQKGHYTNSKSNPTFNGFITEKKKKNKKGKESGFATLGAKRRECGREMLNCVRPAAQPWPSCPAYDDEDDDDDDDSGRNKGIDADCPGDS